MKTLEFPLIIKNIMKIIEFHLKIMKNHENPKITLDNHENNEKP